MGLIQRYVEQAEATLAARRLDAATAAVYPHMGEQAAKRWWASQSRAVNAGTRRRRHGRRARRGEPQRWTPFTLSVVDDGAQLVDAELTPDEFKATMGRVNRSLGGRMTVIDRE